ncbi:hypothetical protein J6590_092401 [Homalodisca vitripennis]|nr:hypothetical protein J6590_092401 [Homalodisca vitripennis]
MQCCSDLIVAYATAQSAFPRVSYRMRRGPVTTPSNASRLLSWFVVQIIIISGSKSANFLCRSKTQCVEF